MLNQREFDSNRADKVNALLSEAASYGIQTTRRQARKALSGRGSLMAQLKIARANAEAAKA